jgi:hypothetical protein
MARAKTKRPKKRTVRKKRRVLSAAQKAALARGRRKLFSKRKPAKRKKAVSRKTVTVKKRTNRKKGVSTMARRKRRRSYVRKSTNEITTLATTAGAATLGAIGAGVLSNVIPFPAKLRPAFPLAAGSVLALATKGKLYSDMALGMFVVGAISALKTFAPQIPMFSGEGENFVFIPASQVPQVPYYGVPMDAAGTGINPGDLSGIPDDLENEEFLTPRNI